LIVRELRALLPGVPVIAEEEVARDGAPDFGGGAVPRRFWLVDPLDGTKEFLKRNGEFTVNIALIEDGRPLLGIVHLPALGLTYAGLAGDGATVQEDGGPARAIAARRPPPEGLVVMSSRSHGDSAALQAFLVGRRLAAQLVAGSSLKFCRIAEGLADLYPRLGRTMEWDTAAGHAVLAAAGGRVTTLDGAELGYGKPGFENPHFVASGRPDR
ncbi:MAG: 3'(2'),5'-bisphosphate nucleotidase CysQ, partial [Rhodospirillaceae bacterium]|nr:3'(2'),5'-bisphosphate nucleotidase CysQ [Rhodospirillaceae bacterium]